MEQKLKKLLNNLEEVIKSDEDGSQVFREEKILVRPEIIKTIDYLKKKTNIDGYLLWDLFIIKGLSGWIKENGDLL